MNAQISISLPKYTPSYESDYGHVDEYKSNYYKHEAKVQQKPLIKY